MSASGKTPNYSIPIYNVGDTANYLNSYNDAMSIIDTQLKNNNNTGDTNAAEIDAIKINDASIETRLKALEDLVAKNIEPIQITNTIVHGPGLTTVNKNVNILQGIIVSGYLSYGATITVSDMQSTIVENQEQVTIATCPGNLYNFSVPMHRKNVGCGYLNYVTSNIGNNIIAYSNINAFYQNSITYFCIPKPDAATINKLAFFLTGYVEIIA